MLITPMSDVEFVQSVLLYFVRWWRHIASTIGFCTPGTGWHLCCWTRISRHGYKCEKNRHVCASAKDIEILVARLLHQVILSNGWSRLNTLAYI